MTRKIPELTEKKLLHVLDETGMKRQAYHDNVLTNELTKDHFLRVVQDL